MSKKDSSRTQIRIVDMFPDLFPCARSQARRLCAYLDGFEEAELDFTGIDLLGQAFAHEVFVLYTARRPEFVLEVVNACEDVGNMIKRVRNTK